VKYARTIRESVSVREVRVEAAKPVLLTSATQPGSVAELTSLIGTIGQQANVRIGTMQVSHDSVNAEEAGLTRLRVRGEGASDIAGITQFVLAIETEQPTLTFRQFAVSQSEPAARTPMVSMRTIRPRSPRIRIEKMGSFGRFSALTPPSSFRLRARKQRKTCGTMRLVDVWSCGQRRRAWRL
jgi:hypothetical protein